MFSDIKSIQLNVWVMHMFGGAWRGELKKLEALEKQVHTKRMDLNV